MDRRPFGIRCKSDSLALSQTGAEGGVVSATPRRKHCVNLCSSFRRAVIARLHQPLLSFVSFASTFALCAPPPIFAIVASTNAEVFEKFSVSRFY